MILNGTLNRRVLMQAALPSFLMAQRSGSLWLYIGAYTGEKNKGITVSQFDLGSGAITEMTLAAESRNPSFLELHPTGKWLYAICEVANFEGQRAGALCAYSIDRATGKLTLLNQVSTKGSGPCHVNLDHTGKVAMIANYGSGSVASYRIEADGKVSQAVSFIQHEGKGPNPKRQEGPHGHSINPTPDNRFAVACDLGLDEVRIYALNTATAEMTFHKAAKLAPGSGPRHFAWHPSGKYGYAVNELASTVTAFSYAAGDLKETQTISTLPEGFKGENWPAEIRVHPTGKWVYASNRGEDTIAAFRVEAKTGKLTRMENTPTQGKNPRNFHIEASGRWMVAANQSTNNVIVFEIDQKTGALKTTGKGMTVGQPVCLRTLGRG